MVMLWVTLLLLHQGYTLTPVTTVQLGEAATFTCVLSDGASSGRFYWYKQSAGDNLRLIVTLREHINPVYGPEFSTSRMDVKVYKNISNLTILRIIPEDEGMYHCAVVDWIKISWSGTYLSLKGKCDPNTQRTNDTVVQWLTVSDPVRPGDSVTLQCSVLSDSENKMCLRDHSVFWFRSASRKSCVYRFSKNVSSSDARTYHCAVAACGEILFGNGIKLQIEPTASLEFIVLVIAIVCLVISVTGNIVFMCNRTPRAARGIESTSSQARHDNASQPVHNITEGVDELNYVALHLTGRKAPTGRKKKELKTEESVYSQIKC
ncbi:uncharacterized protein [Enoplosus armatus]|uniref:uncharacterized protein n=1 Tax=Enoplosus armatus TaxID=215367 RepID=UPI003993D949